NTGPEIVDFVCTNPDDEPSHWFLLDLAIGRELGRVLLGPPPAEVIAPIPRAWQLGAVSDSLAWHGGAEPDSANRRLNAVRGWRYADTGQWGSKQAGAEWARAHRPGVDDLAVADLDATVRRCVEGALDRELRASGTVGYQDVNGRSPGRAG
nr:DUF4111 domain-containing protein [Micromonospora sp. DSM 115978]